MNRSLNIYELEINKTYYFMINSFSAEDEDDDNTAYRVKHIFILHYNGIIADYRNIGTFPFDHLLCLFSNVKPYKSYRTASNIRVFDDEYDAGPYYEIYNDNKELSRIIIRSTNNSLKEFDESIGKPEQITVFVPGLRHSFERFDIDRAYSATPNSGYKNIDYNSFCFHGEGYNSDIRTGQLFLICLDHLWDNTPYSFFEKKSKTDINFNDIFRIRDSLEKKIGQSPAEVVISFLDPKKLGGKRKSKKTRKCR